MTEAIRAFNWRLMRALLAGLMLAGAAVTVTASPAAASPQCPQYTLEPCDDGSGEPTGPAGPPMQGMDPTVDMGEMLPVPTPTEPERMCRNARFSQQVFELPPWQLAYTYDIAFFICVSGSTISVLPPARAVPVPRDPFDPRISYRNFGISVDQATGVVTTSIEVTYCPTGFCQQYIHSVRFLVFPWGGQIRTLADFRWIN